VEPSPVRFKPVAALVAGAGAGGLFGVSESMRTLASATFQRSDAGVVFLLVTGLVTCALAGGLAGLLLGWPLARVTRSSSVWAASWAGLLACLTWEIAVLWFTGDQPSSTGLPLRGSPVVFGVLAGLLLALAVLLVWKVRRVRHRIGLQALVLLVLGGWIWSGVRSHVARSVPPPGAPSVLFVTLDTTRADYVGAYGSSVRTPNFDRLANEGVLFLEAFSPIAVTGPSHTSMLTGTGTWTHGSLLNLVDVPKDLATFPEVLQKSGYRTAAFVSAAVLDGTIGFDRGFDIYDDDFSLLKGSSHVVSIRTAAALRRHFNPELVVERRGGDTVDEALDWLAGQKGPWLLWVHLFDPHGPYQPPPPFAEAYYAGNPKDPTNTSMQKVHDVAPYLKKSLEGITDLSWVLAQYAGEVSYADMQLGRLLGFLDDHGLARSTVVLVAGDHGEDLGDHDTWFEHGDDLYDSSTHVPMAIRFPETLTAGGRVQDPVELSDIAPTLLDLVHQAIPPSMEGRSLLSVIDGSTHRTLARGLCLDRPQNKAARKKGAQKPAFRLVSLRGTSSLFLHHEAPEATDEFYDLVYDPREERSLYGSAIADPTKTDLVSLFQATAERMVQDMGLEKARRSNVTLGSEQTERLRSLGYLE
jgi:arylsulfatase A-like enzyme